MQLGQNSIQKVCLLVAMLALPATLQAQFAFTTNNGSITITSYTGTDSAAVIPAATNGYPVTTIGSYAFLSNPNLTSVTIPNSITNIGDEAFDTCSSLTSVTLPDSVVSLGQSVFAYCTALTNFATGNGLFNIGIQDFNGCTSLASISLGTNLAAIYGSAFAGCSSLTSITLPRNITGINDVFVPCTSLTNISVDAANPYLVSSNGVLFSKDLGFLMQFPGGKGGAYTIPDTVTNLGPYAFNQCAAVTSVTIPKGVLKINNNALQFCFALTNITVNSTNSVFSSTNGVLFNKSRTVLIQYPGGKPGLYTVPNTVTNIGTNSFYSTFTLAGVIIPKNVDIIRAGAFGFCTNLSTVIISNGVTSIEAQAFWGCLSLTNIIIPASVTNLASAAFATCPNLVSVFFSSNAPVAGNPSLGGAVFQGDLKAVLCYLPGTTGWASTYGGAHTVKWNGSISTTNTSPSIQTNQFGFTISGDFGIPVVVIQCTNLTNPAWQPVQTNILTSNSFYFSDPQWTNYPTRLYRLRSP